eukprot:gene4605-5211_t
MAAYIGILFVLLSLSTMNCATLPSVPGNLTLRGFFDIHLPEGDKECAKIDTRNAIVFMEAFRYAINRTNQNPHNFYKLGYTIRDTCQSSVKLKGIIKDTAMSQVPDLILGVVGPGTTDAAFEISQVVDAWELPAISYAVGSSSFSHKKRHEYVLRTVPDDSYLRKALLDVIRHFNWSYVSVVGSCSVYNQDELSLFVKTVRDDSRCLARMTRLCDRTVAGYEKELKSVLKDSRVRVLVMLTDPDDTLGILTAAKSIGLSPGRLTLLASTGWGNLDLKTAGLEDVARGALTLTYASNGSMAEFKEHFFSLNPRNNNYEAFIQFWEEIFNCSTGLLTDSTKTIACTGAEKLAEGKGWNPFTNVQPVFDAVYALYRPLVAIIPYCFYPLIICPMHAVRQSSKFPKWLMSNKFLDMTNTRHVSFNSMGSVERDFNVLNVARAGYKVVGTWRSNGVKPDLGQLHMLDKSIEWSGKQGVPASVCSTPCRTENGEITIVDRNEYLKICCWECQKCLVHEWIANNTCKPCGSKEKPNAKRTACVNMPERTVEYTDPVGIVVLCCSILGMLATTGVLVLFIKYHSSPIIKASGREASLFMLAGIYLCFISPLIYLANPSMVVCGAQRFIAGLSFSIVYAPLVLKTNRLYRIFQSAKSTTARPSLISPLSQVLISLGIVSVQLLLGIIWVIGDQPRVETRYASDRQYAEHYCKLDPITMVLNLLICLIMMLACTWYAFKTRHFPKNYNESKSIMFTLYFSCFIWGISVPTFILSNAQDSFFRAYTLAIFSELIAFVSLVGFFFPKIRLLFCTSQVNNNANGMVIANRVPGANTETTLGMHYLETKRIVVGGTSEHDNQKTISESISCGSTITKLSECKEEETEKRQFQHLKQHSL